jgi:hypothetical protein
MCSGLRNFAFLAIGTNCISTQPTKTPLLRRHLQNQLPKILAIKKLEQRLAECVNADHDVFFRFHLAVFQIPGHFGNRDAVAICAVEDDDALHAGAFNE